MLNSLFDWLDWDKLKREWKTAALLVAGVVIETYDALVIYGMLDLPKLIPDWTQPWGGPVFLMTMLLLRKWKDSADA